MQQFSALFGAVIGAILTFTLSNLGERHRWRRDQRVRWDAARLQAYVDYGNAVKRVVHVASGMARTRGLRHASEAVPLEQGQVELGTAVADRTAKWESVLLLGHHDTLQAARAWHQSVWQLEFFARGVLTGEEAWGEALDEFERTRNEFYRCARTDLGLAGQVPPTSWPPRWLDRLSTEQRAALIAATEPRGQNRCS
jgi:hypothetical protein